MNSKILLKGLLVVICLLEIVVLIGCSNLEEKNAQHKLLIEVASDEKLDYEIGKNKFYRFLGFSLRGSGLFLLSGEDFYDHIGPISIAPYEDVFSFEKSVEVMDRLKNRYILSIGVNDACKDSDEVELNIEIHFVSAQKISKLDKNTFNQEMNVELITKQRLEIRKGVPISVDF